jgi:hypothetical protein
VTACFRAIYYASDRLSFFRHVASYTQKKLVFDLNPRQYSLDEVREDLKEAGLDGFAMRPFYVPQTRRLPPALSRLLIEAERAPALAKVLLRFRFTYICAAFRRAA